MGDIVKTQIVEMEERLRAAMLNSDVSALDQLLASDLVFTNHLGHLMNKEDDLNAHSSGAIKISHLDMSEQIIRTQKECATVSVRARIKGQFQGNPSDVDMRFTRVWVKASTEHWQVSVAHSCLVT